MNIFIGYARKDFQAASKKAGLHTWLDKKEDILPRENWKKHNRESFGAKQMLRSSFF
jgi:hypothetical protein